MYRPLSGLLLLLACGCNDELEDLTRIDNTRFVAEYAVPLIDSEIALADAVGGDGNVAVTTDAQGRLTLKYSGNLPAVSSAEIFAQLDPLAAGVFLPITARRNSVPLVLPGDLALEALRLGRGELRYNLPNRYDRPVRIRLSIPSASLDGTPIVVSGELPAYGGSGTSPTLSNENNPINLTDYVLDLMSEETDLIYEIEDLAGNPLEPSQGTAVAFTGLRFTLVTGYLGQASYAGERDTIRVNLFDRYQNGDIFFADPKITIVLTNSFGVPARAVIDVLNVVTLDGEVIPVVGSAITDGFDFNYPREPGATAQTTFTFDRTNTNLPEIISARPVAIDIAISAIINPDANTELRGFLTDTSAYSATVSVELPLVGSATAFTIQDTFALNIADQYPNFTAATLRLTTDNTLPLGVALEGTLYDGDGNALVDLADGQVLIIRGSEGAPTTVTTDFPFTGERLEQLRRAERLVVTAAFTTTGAGEQIVALTETQRLRIRLGARITVDKR